MKNIDREMYENMIKASQEFHTQKTMFDARVQEVYKEHYSDYDIDSIIDTIDYGQGNMPYECFCELMQTIADGNGNDVNLRNSILKKYWI